MRSWSRDDIERGNARYITPPYGLRADGPLMTGGCAPRAGPESGFEKPASAVLAIPGVS